MKPSTYLGPSKWVWGHETTPAFMKNSGENDSILRSLYTTADTKNQNWKFPDVHNRMILGHEGVGIVTKTGSGVSSFRVGDRALISSIASCGKCAACRSGIHSICEESGWILGHLMDGSQAEYIYASDSDEDSSPLMGEHLRGNSSGHNNFLLTGYECGVLNGQIKSGDTVAIIGAGRIGIAALLTAQFYSPSAIIVIDPDRYRLATAMSLGATRLVRSDKINPVSDIIKFTAGQGVDVAIETIGISETLAICRRITGVNGRTVRMAAHGSPVELHLGMKWAEKISIVPRLVYKAPTPLQLKTVISGRLRPVH